MVDENEKIEEGHSDPFKISKPDLKKYNTEVNDLRAVRIGNIEQASILETMRQSGDLLDQNDPLYTLMYTIQTRLNSGHDALILLSKKDTVEAYTAPRAETVVITAGILVRFREFLQNEKKHDMSEDHAAFILAHELSHWDKEANVFHLNETYCDTNAIRLCSDAGYNLDCALEALEFLESLADSNAESSEDHIPITHPSEEGRRILGESIIHDPNIHLDGRYAEVTPLSDELINNFSEESKIYVSKKELRARISSFDELRSQITQAQTVGELHEVLIGGEEYLSSEDVRKFSKTTTYKNILLAFAVFADQTNAHDVLNNEDLFMQSRAELQSHEVAMSEAHGSFQKFLTVEADADPKDILIYKILNGEFDDPMDILLHPDQYSDFTGITFDTFFSRLHSNILDFSATYEQAGYVLKIDDEVKDFLGKTYGNRSENVHESRDVILQKFQFGLANKILTISKDGYWDFDSRGDPMSDHGQNWSSVLQKMNDEIETDRVPISQLRTLIHDQLIAIQWCQTEEIASDMTTMLLQSFDHAQTDDAMFHRNWNIRNPPKIVSSRDPEVLTDALSSVMNLHLELPFVNQRKMFGIASHVSTLNEMVEDYIRIFTTIGLDGQPDPDKIMLTLNAHPQVAVEGIKTGESVNVTKMIFSDEALQADINWDTKEADYKQELPGKISFFEVIARDELESIEKTPPPSRAELRAIRLRDMDPEYSVKSPFVDREYCKRWIFETLEQSERGVVLDAMLHTPEIQEDTIFWDSVLKEGIQKKLITSTEIFTILNGLQDEQLYVQYREYMSGRSLEFFERRDFDKLVSSRSPETPIPFLIAEFIEQGGIPDSYWEEIDLIGLDDYPFDKSEMLIAGKRINEFIARSGSLIDSGDIRVQMASDWTRFGLGLNSLMSAEGNQGFLYISSYGENISGFSSLLDVLEQMPMGSLRDEYLTHALLTVSYSRSGEDSFITTEGNLSDQDVVRIIRQYTPSFIRAYSFEGAGLRNVKTTIRPISLDSSESDIAFQYQFLTHQLHDREAFDLLLGEIKRLIPDRKSLSITEATEMQITFLESLLPYSSGVRDYFIESALLPFTQVDSTDNALDIPRTLLEKAYNMSTTMRTHGMIASILLKQDMTGINNFSDGMNTILKYLPGFSTSRDKEINILMNGKFTSWTDIDTCQKLLVGHSYRTNEKGIASRSAALEAISLGIEHMSQNDRTEMLQFLLDVREHEFRTQQLTVDFFTEKNRKNLRETLMGIRSVFRLTEYGISKKTLEPIEALNENEVDLAVSYLLAVHTKKTSNIPFNIPGDLQRILDKLTPADIFNLAVPVSLSEFMNATFSDNEHPISTTSLGGLFMKAPSQEQREILFRLCLGKNGIFEEKNFPVAGNNMLTHIVQYVTGIMNSSDNQQSWDKNEITLMRDILSMTFSQFSPSRRTEVLSRLFDLVSQYKGVMHREDLLMAGLLAVDGVGPKIAQTDAIIPPWAREALKRAKEEVPPIPKATIAYMLRIEGRQDVLDGLGPILNSASMGVVISAKSKYSEMLDRAIKVIRPNLARTYQGDLDAVSYTLQELVRRGILSVNTNNLILEWRTMMREELDPHTEAEHMMSMKEARGRIHSPIECPNLYFVGKRFLELELIQGISLSKLMTMYEKNKVSPEYKHIDLQNIYKLLLWDFFKLASKTGNFNGDPHSGNYFIRPDETFYQLDYGQQGHEPDQDKRNVFLPFTLGIALNRLHLVAKALIKFAPEMQAHQIEEELNKTPGIVSAVTGLLSEHKIPGSINRFIKASANLIPIIQASSRTTLLKAFIPIFRLRDLADFL